MLTKQLHYYVFYFCHTIFRWCVAFKSSLTRLDDVDYPVPFFLPPPDLRLQCLRYVYTHLPLASSAPVNQKINKYIYICPCTLILI